MKKVLIVLGIVFLVLVALAAAGFGFLALKGRALDKESREFVDTAIPAIVSEWDKQALFDCASPELMAAIKDEQWNELFAAYRRLGKLTKYRGSQGKAIISYTSQDGKLIYGDYMVRADFEAAPAQIKVRVIKHGDNWQILGFHVNSKIFLKDL